MDKELGRKIKREFGNEFATKAGVIEGEDSLVVQMVSLSVTCFCSLSYLEEKGIPSNELALMVEWIPAGMEFEKTESEIPNEKGINSNLIPPKEEQVIFPKVYQGIPVYYRRGSMFFAL